jgi:hypothetical protein
MSHTHAYAHIFLGWSFPFVPFSPPSGFSWNFMSCPLQDGKKGWTCTGISMICHQLILVAEDTNFQHGCPGL